MESNEITLSLGREDPDQLVVEREEGEAKFRRLADTIPQLAWLAEPSGNVSWLNRRWYDYTGAAEDQSLGLGWQSFVDPAALPELMQRWEASIRSEAPFEMVTSLRGADGQFHPFLTLITPLAAGDGTPALWCGTNTDITERRDTEDCLLRKSRSLRLLADCATRLLSAEEPEGSLNAMLEETIEILRLDVYMSFLIAPDGGPLHVAAHGGVKSSSETDVQLLEMGRAISSLVAQRGERIVEENVQQSTDPLIGIIRRLGVSSFVCQPMIARGQLIGILSFGSYSRAVFDADELEIVRALSEQVAVALTRFRAEEALRDLDRRKDEFISMLAHELRNPLAPIRTAVQLLGRTSEGQVVQQVRDIVGRQVEHLSHIVDDLLEASRIMGGRVELRRERIDFAQVVRFAVSDCTVTFEAAGIKLSLEAPQTPIWVDGDRTRLTQAVENLLSNAAKFTDTGGQVKISAREQGDVAVLSISDTGIGIEAELLPRLFEPFAQADRTLDRSRGGLGLGLALVKGLVELHGGTVRAESAGLGKGAEFILELELSGEPAALKQSSPRPHRTATRVLKALIIEDNKDAAESLRMLLELTGCLVMVAFDGPSGIAAACSFHPDLVLCDIGLPGLSGYDVARQIRESLPLDKPMLVALTGYGEDDDRRLAHEAGFDQHFTKPMDPDIIEDLVVHS